MWLLLTTPDCICSGNTQSVEALWCTQEGCLEKITRHVVAVPGTHDRACALSQRKEGQVT